MKLKISVGQKPFSGYMNIDPAIQLEKDKLGQFEFRPVDFREINRYIFNAECNEIVIDHALDYIRYDELEPVLGAITSKLRHRGVIHLSGTDSVELAKKLLNGEISQQEYNQIMYGEGNHPWSFKSGSYSLHIIESLLRKFGLKIISKKIDGIYLYISAERE